MLTAVDYKEILELALDRDLASFEMNANFYEDYELDSMGAVALFVELERRTGIEITEALAPTLQSGTEVEAYLQSVGVQ